MLIHLLSQNNYVQFNITLANTIGLHESIYLSELMDINDKAVRKNCLVDNMFIIDREYVASRTTIKPEEQKKIDEQLKTIGVLNIDDSNSDRVEININMLVSIMSSKDEHIIKDVEKIVKESASASKKTKVDYMTKMAKQAILTNNTELRTAYFMWIESVVSKTKWISPKTVEAAQDAIDEYSHRNLDIALDILKIATANGYVDMIWAIKIYEQYSNMNTKSKMNSVQSVASADDVGGVMF